MPMAPRTIEGPVLRRFGVPAVDGRSIDEQGSRVANAAGQVFSESSFQDLGNFVPSPEVRAAGTTASGEAQAPADQVPGD